MMDDGGSEEEEDASADHAVKLLWFGGSEKAEGDLDGWAPAGSSTLTAHSDPAPPPLSATAGDVPGECKRKPSGRYVLAAHRADEKDGQIRQAPKPKVAYRVTGWVSVEGGPAGADGCHAVHVEVRTGEGSSVGGGVLLAEAWKWTEIKGAFRVDEQARRTEVYVHGPPAGVDIKVMDQLVNADGTLSEDVEVCRAADGVDVARPRDGDVNGNFMFRGFQGKYVVELAAGAGGKVTRTVRLHTVTRGIQNIGYLDWDI